MAQDLESLAEERRRLVERIAADERGDIRLRFDEVALLMQRLKEIDEQTAAPSKTDG